MDDCLPRTKNQTAYTEIGIACREARALKHNKTKREGKERKWGERACDGPRQQGHGQKSKLRRADESRRDPSPKLVLFARAPLFDLGSGPIS
ncbi:hypothetical protein ASPBRDRAFT_283036 [Aspergillus brasiliensis CBS 101740]|uniref:Uncharacterized protein n=1 Tax=Aspergillus brasiliensis (strain CBS 101740 / IMI 381727 / IBT 21946) TaxID=767769 RepID=A0A1L9UD48_ASPBC|nr:hypothetical protein ASPBRDRAFT_283036 [Aspergillus brasiliensis CBS 101740]